MCTDSLARNVVFIRGVFPPLPWDRAWWRGERGGESGYKGIPSPGDSLWKVWKQSWAGEMNEHFIPGPPPAARPCKMWRLGGKSI